MNAAVSEQWETGLKLGRVRKLDNGGLNISITPIGRELEVGYIELEVVDIVHLKKVLQDN